MDKYQSSYQSSLFDCKFVITEMDLVTIYLGVLSLTVEQHPASS